MTERFILASSSTIRSRLLKNAGLNHEVIPARIDELSLLASLQAEAVKSRDIADTLAEAKARRIAQKNPEALVLGCDQVLDLKGSSLTKPANRNEARTQLEALRNQTHHLYSAAVLYENNTPIWRQIGHARMTMYDISENYLSEYIDRNWESIRHSVGCYKLEEEGVRLFSKIDGCYFTILGLPLPELLSYLRLRGTLMS